MKKETKNFFKLISKNRYRNIKTYKFDRWIFTIAMLLIFGYLAFVMFHYNFNLDYYKCVNPAMGDKCKNPFYKPITWKNLEYLAPGEYGQKPGILFKLIWVVVVGGLVITVLLNHFLHNRDFKFKEVGEELFEDDLSEDIILGGDLENEKETETKDME